MPYAEYRNDPGIYRAIYKKEPPKRPGELIGPDERAEQMWELLLHCWNHDPWARPNASSVFTSVSAEGRDDLPPKQNNPTMFHLQIFDLAEYTLGAPKDTPYFDMVTGKMVIPD